MALEKQVLFDLNDEVIENTVTAEFKQPKFRAKQLKEWILKGYEFCEMSNLPKGFRDALQEKYNPLSLTYEYKMVENKTDTTKYLFKTKDDIIIESVGLIYDGKLTVCVSTQAGCAMGCKFCSSTVGGLIRNLTADEMVAQLVLASKDKGLSVNNIVLMGSGEPLNNYDNVKEFIDYITKPDTLNIGIRHITLSTCGLAKGIDRMCEDKLFVNLSLSLHSAVSEIRKSIMPVENACSFTEAFEACCRFREASGRRITLEYCVIEGINDGEESARALFSLMKGTDAEVNLIDYNKKEGYLKQNSTSAADEFAKKLKKYKINYTLRRRLGSSINAACGQLKSRYLKGESK